MEYIFPGLVIGAVYAILGNSITLTYSATGVLNLATGTIAYVIADLFYNLVAVHGWSLLAAGLFSIVLVAPLFGLLLWATVFRQMEGSNLVVQVVATIGLAVALPALMQVIFPDQQVQQAPARLGHGRLEAGLGRIAGSAVEGVPTPGAVLPRGEGRVAANVAATAFGAGLALPPLGGVAGGDGDQQFPQLVPAVKRTGVVDLILHS